jgi:hypothetical protein
LQYHCKPICSNAAARLQYYCKKHAPSLQWEVADCQIWFFLLILPSSIVSYPFILFIRVKL